MSQHKWFILHSGPLSSNYKVKGKASSLSMSRAFSAEYSNNENLNVSILATYTLSIYSNNKWNTRGSFTTNYCLQKLSLIKLQSIILFVHEANQFNWSASFFIRQLEKYLFCLPINNCVFFFQPTPANMLITCSILWIRITAD